jgi:hypothetical protein
MLEQIAALIAAAPNGEMEFSEFVNAALQQRLRPQLWLQAKHAGLIDARIDPDGRHILSAVRSVAADEGAVG